MSIKRILLLFIALVSSAFIQAQDIYGPNKAPLEEVLDSIQERFKVQFNYASRIVQGVSASRPSEVLGLKDVVAALEKETGLDFEFLSENIISITEKKFTLCGYLKDKDSRAPLDGATIQFNGQGAVADQNGFFQLEVKNRQGIVLLRHLGHRPIRREFQFFPIEPCGVIYMVAEQQKLEDVILSDYLVRGMDKLNTGGLRLDFNSFSILPGLVEDDVLFSIQALPGIQSVDETVSTINIRGGSNDQNLLLWDDIKMYQSGHFFGLISMFNPETTKQAIVQKNGTSSAFTDGVSGTIALLSEKTINPTIKGSVGLNMLNATGFVDFPAGQKASVQIGLRKSLSDFLQSPTYTQYFERITQDSEVARNNLEFRDPQIGFDFYDSSLRMLYRPSDRDLLRVNFILTANDLVFDEQGLLNGQSEVRQSQLKQTSLAGGLFYKRRWNPRWSTEIQWYETAYQLKAINSNVEENQRFLQENSVSESSGRILLQRDFSSNLTLKNGYHYVESKVSNLDDVDNPLFRLLVGEVLRTHGIFTELDWRSSKRKTWITAGLRYNRLGKFKKELWEPRFSLNQKLSPDFTLEISGELKHQNTSQVINFQSDFLGVEKRRWQLANNENIPVIQSRQASTGISFQRKSWLFNLEGFAKDVEGITTQSQGFQDAYEFQKSVGSYQAYGIDFLMRKQISNYSFWLNYSYLNTEYTFKELPETAFRNNFDIRHSLSSGLSFTAQKFKVSLGGNWRSGVPFTPLRPNAPLEDGELNFSAANSGQLPDYFRLDLSAIYETQIGPKTKLRSGVALWNLLNQRNTISTYFRINSEGQPEQFFEQSLGITPNASMKIMF